MTIRDDLAAAIAASGKSVNQIAKEAGVPQSVVTRFLQGTDIRLSAVEKLAQHFGLSLTPRAEVKPKKNAKRAK